jgi:hypothetical protein
MRHLYYISIVLTFIIPGCQSQNGLSEYENTEIVFGSGGGYSGQIIEYSIGTDRVITSTNSLTKETKTIGKLSKKETKALYDGLSELKLPLVNYNKPGNMSYFVKQVKGNKEAKVVWGDINNDYPKNIKAYYDLLMSIVNEKNN